MKFKKKYVSCMYLHDLSTYAIAEYITDRIIQTAINDHTSVFKLKAMYVATTRLIRFIYMLIMNMHSNS